MNCDFIVFGHGHDGVLRDTEYNGEATVALEPAVVVFANRGGMDNGPRMRPLGPVIFRVIRHRSAFDGQTYYIAIGEGAIEEEILENIDIKILGFRPRQAI